MARFARLTTLVPDRAGGFGEAAARFDRGFAAAAVRFDRGFAVAAVRFDPGFAADAGVAARAVFGAGFSDAARRREGRFAAVPRRALVFSAAALVPVSFFGALALAPRFAGGAERGALFFAGAAFRPVFALLRGMGRA